MSLGVHMQARTLNWIVDDGVQAFFLKLIL